MGDADHAGARARDAQGEPAQVRTDAAPTASTATRARGARVTARRLSLKGSRGWVYRNVDLTVPPGGIAAVEGEAGSGRTSLLLTLAGRMRPTSGTASVDDHPLPKQLRAVQRLAALGAIDGVNVLEPSLTLAEHVTEATSLYHPLFYTRRASREEEVHAALDRVGLTIDPDTLAHDLRPEDRQLVGVALALLGNPTLLVLDDVDSGLMIDSQQNLWTRLRAVAESGVTIIASCHDAGPAQDLTETVRLPHPTEAAR